MRVPVKVKKINELAIIPEYAHDGDTGFDLYSINCKELLPDETALISTGLKFEIPRGYGIAIRPRSGLSLKTGLRIANSPGTIDSVYRGELKIIVQNTSDRILHIDIGQRIAQGVLEKVPKAEFIEVDELGDTERGEGGFGHTGE